MSRIALLPLVGAVVFGVAACSLPGPPPAEYVLGVMSVAKATATPQTGLPVIEVKRVQVPDYLDTTDILERRGNALVRLPASRWGERLSVGMTRALAASLAVRLPHMVVTATPSVERPMRQILVDVGAFDATADRKVVLVVRWTVVDGASRRVLLTEEASLVEPIAGAGDGALVAAMSRALEALADQLAAGIEGDRRAG